MGGASSPVEYLCGMKARIRSDKAGIIRRLSRLLRPKLRSSGFVDEKSADGHLQLCTWPEPTRQRLHKGYEVTASYGFTADAVIADAAGGGISTVRFAAMPVEDLIMIEQYLREHSRELE